MEQQKMEQQKIIEALRNSYVALLSLEALDQKRVITALEILLNLKTI